MNPFQPLVFFRLRQQSYFKKIYEGEIANSFSLRKSLRLINSGYNVNKCYGPHRLPVLLQRCKLKRLIYDQTDDRAKVLNINYGVSWLLTD